MFRIVSKPPLLAEAGLLALCPSLNSPVLNSDDLPVGPARAAILVYAEEYGDLRVSVAVRSIATGDVQAFVYRGRPGDLANAGQAMDVALTFAEGMGFVFDDDWVPRQGKSAALDLWTEISGGGVPAEAAADADLELDELELSEESPFGQGTEGLGTDELAPTGEPGFELELAPSGEPGFELELAPSGEPGFELELAPDVGPGSDLEVAPDGAPGSDLEVAPDGAPGIELDLDVESGQAAASPAGERDDLLLDDVAALELDQPVAEAAPVAASAPTLTKFRRPPEKKAQPRKTPASPAKDAATTGSELGRIALVRKRLGGGPEPTEKRSLLLRLLGQF